MNFQGAQAKNMCEVWGYNEKELKDALMDNVQNFLMELGTGFAFVGREYRLQVGNTEQYIDMLKDMELKKH